ncbi:hypothetical protein HPB47_006881, partial [Ixodes persulcatus]
EGPPETLALQVALDSNVNSYLAYASVFEEMVTRTKKVFVGGLSAPTTLEDVKNYFQQFGRADRPKPRANSSIRACSPSHWPCRRAGSSGSSLVHERESGGLENAMFCEYLIRSRRL